MSTRTTRSRVQAVSSTALPIELAGCAIAAATIIAAAVRALSQEGRKTFGVASQPVQATRSSLIAPVSVLRQHSEAHETTIKQAIEQSKLSALEAAKVETLAKIAAMPYLVRDPVACSEPLAKITRASSIIEVKRGEVKLRQKLELEHHQLFTSTLVQACSTAAKSIGFDSIETLPSPLPSMVRVVATDKAGRSLVTEINVDPERDTSIETEVIGVTDGSCDEIMDQFDAALEADGVRSTPPTRKFTGGVCETAAALAFLRQKVKQIPMAATMNTSRKDDTRRRQRLNTDVAQKQR